MKNNFTMNEKIEAERRLDQLSEKAFKVYSSTDPLDIYYKNNLYHIRGCLGDKNDLELDDLNNLLEMYF